MSGSASTIFLYGSARFLADSWYILERCQEVEDSEGCREAILYTLMLFPKRGHTGPMVVDMGVALML
jgi:hypothetical protein